MSMEVLRLECLRMAMAQVPQVVGDDLIRLADHYFKFVFGGEITPATGEEIMHPHIG